MTWADFYLVCFGVGFVFSLVSFLTGGLHWHLPFGHHLPHGAAAGHGAAGRAGGTSPFNAFTLAAFLTWFGGTGYLLTRYWTPWFGVGLGIAVLGGLVAGAIVYLFLTRVLMSSEENLDAGDYDMTGVLGRLSLPIREGGTGELIYSQAGTRRTCGARSESGRAIARDTEVIVTRYENGIAYVRPWEEMAGEVHDAEDGEGAQR